MDDIKNFLDENENTSKPNEDLANESVLKIKKDEKPLVDNNKISKNPFGGAVVDPDLIKNSIKASSKLKTDVVPVTVGINPDNPNLDEFIEQQTKGVPFLPLFGLIILGSSFFFITGIKNFINGNPVKRVNIEDKKKTPKPVEPEEDNEVEQKDYERYEEDYISLDVDHIRNHLNENETIKKLGGTITETGDTFKITYGNTETPNKIDVIFAGNQLTVPVPSSTSNLETDIEEIVKELVVYVGLRHGLDERELDIAVQSLDTKKENNGFYRSDVNGIIAYIIKTDVRFYLD